MVFYYNISGVETTFGVNLLKSFGSHYSYVFSPVALLFALSLMKKDEFKAPVYKQYSDLGFDNNAMQEYLKKGLTGIKVESEGKIKKRNQIKFDAFWESILTRKVQGVFHTTRSVSNALTYVMKDHQLYINADEHFIYLSIPYKNNNLQFFILLPMERFGLKTALKKLTKQRLEDLHYGATLEHVKAVIPKIDILPILVKSKEMGLQPPMKINLKQKNTAQVFPIIHLPEFKESHFVHADHPFVFGIMRSNHLVYMGIYKGK